MARASLAVLAAALPIAFAACSGEEEIGEAQGAGGSTASGGKAGGGTAGSAATASGGTGGLSIDTGVGDGGSPACSEPDLLIVLDRSTSMVQAPDGMNVPDTPAGRAQTKWSLAISAIEGAAAALETEIRFGLELFPKDPGALACVKLSEAIGGKTATNLKCEGAELVVPPALGTASTIAGLLDTTETPLCNSTPVGKAFELAATTLAATGNPPGRQFAVLITDGQDSCDEAFLLEQVQKLALTGSRVYVIGFDASPGSGIDASQLNDVACAGRTATDFQANCKDTGGGHYVAKLSGAPPLFLLAQDGPELQESLESIAKGVCCGCVH